MSAFEAGDVLTSIFLARRSPLQCASYSGSLNCMSVLIEKGADVNAQDSEGITALHWACRSGYLEAVKLLLKSYAFPNFREVDGERYSRRYLNTVPPPTGLKLDYF